MNSNAEFEALARELQSLRQAPRKDAEAQARETMLVVRLVRGLSRNRWQEFCRSFPSSQWCALPLSESHEFVQVADLRPDIQEPLPPDLPSDSLAKALALELFTAQLNREILRLARSGGELTLVCAALCERKRLLAALGEGTVKRLDSLLAETLHEGLEACDSLGQPRARTPRPAFAGRGPVQGPAAGGKSADRLCGAGPAADSAGRHLSRRGASLRPGHHLPAP